MDEKTMVFHEIMPNALSLMTDVFGNYVIQKVILLLALDLNTVFVIGGMLKCIANSLYKAKNFPTCLMHT